MTLICPLLWEKMPPPPMQWKGPGGHPPQGLNPAMAFQYQQQLNYQRAGASMMSAGSPYGSGYPVAPRGAVYPSPGIHYPYPQQHLPPAAQKSPRPRQPSHPVPQPSLQSSISVKALHAAGSSGLGSRMASGASNTSTNMVGTAISRPVEMGTIRLTARSHAANLS